jgi:Uma2 family endonuclease
MVMISTQVNELELEDFQGKVTQNIVLPNVSWQTYKALLADMGDHRASRLTYDQGILQIKMPSKLHEIINRLLARIITTLTEELELNVVDLGSTILDREDLEKGAEPDTCFYIQNAINSKDSILRFLKTCPRSW